MLWGGFAIFYLVVVVVELPDTKFLARYPAKTVIVNVNNWFQLIEVLVAIVATQLDKPAPTAIIAPLSKSFKLIFPNTDVEGKIAFLPK